MKICTKLLRVDERRAAADTANSSWYGERQTILFAVPGFADVWKQFRDDFERWTEDDFEDDVLNIRLRRLRNTLRKRGV